MKRMSQTAKKEILGVITYFTHGITYYLFLQDFKDIDYNNVSDIINGIRLLLVWYINFSLTITVLKMTK